MTDQKYVIQVDDKVSSSIPTKLSTIAREARDGGTAVERLKSALASIDVSAINALSAANARAQQMINQNVLAAQRLATEQQRTATAAQALATAQQRTSTAQTQGATAAQGLATATARVATAQVQTQNAAARLATEQARTTRETANAAAAADRAALASLRLQQAQNKVATASRAAGTGIASFVRGGLLLAGITVGVQGFIELADAATTLSNKLNIVSESSEQTTELTRRLFEISNRTRTSIEATVTSYARLDNALINSGKSQEETLRLQETLNKLFIVGGASASEQSNALLQLSQAFNSGKLQGDEFRSLMENMPRQVRTAIAEAAGVNESALKKLSSEGKITAEVLFKAFKSLDGFADSKFANTVPTLSQSFTVLKNNAIEAFQKINNQLHITEGISAFLLGIPNVIGKLIDAFDAIAGFIRGLLVFIGRAFMQMTTDIANGITRAYNAVLQFIEDTVNAAIKGTNFLREKAGLDAYDLIQFDKIGEQGAGEFEGYGALWARTLNESFERQQQSGLRSLLSGPAAATNVLRGSGVDKTGAGVDTSKRVEALRRINDELAAQADRLFMLKPLREQQEQFDKIELDLKKKGIDLTATEAEGIRSRISAIQGAQEVQKKFDEIYEAAIAPARDYNSTLAAAAMLFERGAISQLDYDRAITKATETYQDAIDPLRQVNKEISQQNELLALLPAEREIEQRLQQITNEQLAQGIVLTRDQTEALRDRLTAQQQLNNVSQQEAQIFSSTIGARQQYLDQLTAISNLKAKGLGTGDAASAIAAANPDLDFQNTQTGIDARVQQFDDMYARIETLRQKDLINEETAAALRMQVWAKQEAANLETASQFFTGLSQLSKSENTKIAAIGKAAAITQATIDTYKAATGAYSALAGIPYVGPYLGAAAAAAAIVAGMANVNAIRSQPTGYMAGGYTGDIGRNQVAGAVHGQEYVFDANSTSRIGVQNLEALRAGASSVQGSQSTAQNAPQVTVAPAQVNQRIVNVFDKGVVGDYLSTPEGEDVLVNVVRKNSDSLRAAIA